MFGDLNGDIQIPIIKSLKNKIFVRKIAFTWLHLMHAGSLLNLLHSAARCLLLNLLHPATRCLLLHLYAVICRHHFLVNLDLYTL